MLVEYKIYNQDNYKWEQITEKVKDAYFENGIFWLEYKDKVLQFKDKNKVFKVGYDDFCIKDFKILKAI